MRNAYLWSIVLGLCCAAHVASAQQESAARSDPAAWAPPDAVLFVGVADIDQLWKDYQRTASYAAMNDEAIKEGAANVRLFNKIVEKVKQRLG